MNNYAYIAQVFLVIEIFLLPKSALAHNCPSTIAIQNLINTQPVVKGAGLTSNGESWEVAEYAPEAGAMAGHARVMSLWDSTPSVDPDFCSYAIGNPQALRQASVPRMLKIKRMGG